MILRQSAATALVVPSLDRDGRSFNDLITMVDDLLKREIGVASLHARLDTTPDGRLVFSVSADPAKFIRELVASGPRSRRPRIACVRRVRPAFPGGAGRCVRVLPTRARGSSG
ncbi:recombinase family protein [Thermomonospora echinospora]|uniref:recombinase family protein n=1 Tax=Thermomonospora echinospora TaxID=1992 RepID=UPI000CDEB163|nr:recombinase family protein [Thermomonospora echinospora]